MIYQTIPKAAKEVDLPEYAVRTMQRRGEVPGFFRGSRYYVNLPLFREKLEEMCRAQVEQSGGELNAR